MDGPTIDLRSYPAALPHEPTEETFPIFSW